MHAHTHTLRHTHMHKFIRTTRTLCTEHTKHSSSATLLPCPQTQTSSASLLLLSGPQEFMLWTPSDVSVPASQSVLCLPVCVWGREKEKQLFGMRAVAKMTFPRQFSIQKWLHVPPVMLTLSSWSWFKKLFSFEYILKVISHFHLIAFESM